MAHILSHRVVSDWRSTHNDYDDTVVEIELPQLQLLQSVARNVKARAERPRSTAFGANRGCLHIVIHGQHVLRLSQVRDLVLPAPVSMRFELESLAARIASHQHSCRQPMGATGRTMIR